MPKAARQTTKPVLTTNKATEVELEETQSAHELMQVVLAKPRKTEFVETPIDTRINGVVIGTLSDATEDGQPMVYYPGIPSGEPLPAISTENLTKHESGQEVALGFVNGDPASPIVLGLIQKTGKPAQTALQETSKDQSLHVKLDGEKLTLSADHEIVLQCGKASITLTKAGKVILKGAYLSTHSTGVNRIKGGSVQIN